MFDDSRLWLFADKIGNRDYILSFDYVTLDEDAEYMAIARNVAGEARSTAQLIVDLPAAGECTPWSPEDHMMVSVAAGQHVLPIRLETTKWSSFTEDHLRIFIVDSGMPWSFITEDHMMVFNPAGQHTLVRSQWRNANGLHCFRELNPCR